MRNLIRSAVAPLFDWRLVTLHLAGNALLFAAVTLWLLIPEGHAWQLLLSAISGLLILFAFTWLHCGTLVHGLTPVRESLNRDFRLSVRHLPVWMVFIGVLALLMIWLEKTSERSWQISGYFFTRLPHFLQGSIGESRFHDWVLVKFYVLIWFLLPALFLPFLSAASSSGFSLGGFGKALRTYARWKYWLAVAVAALLGIWVPNVLVNWTPLHGLAKETISMVLRLLAAYMLAVAAWLMTSAVVGSFLQAAPRVNNVGGNAVG